MPLLAAGILATRKLTQFDGGKKSSGRNERNPDAAGWTEEIMKAVDQRCPAFGIFLPSLASDARNLLIQSWQYETRRCPHEVMALQHPATRSVSKQKSRSTPHPA